MAAPQISGTKSRRTYAAISPIAQQKKNAATPIPLKLVVKGIVSRDTKLGDIVSSWVILVRTSDPAKSLLAPARKTPAHQLATRTRLQAGPVSAPARPHRAAPS